MTPVKFARRLVFACGFFCTLIILTLALSGHAASVKVTKPVCEYLNNPLGLDVLQPRLSWKLTPIDAAANGQRQQAWQVLVTSSAERLKRDQGDLWNSGWVNSNQSQLNSYDAAAAFGRGMFLESARAR